jgi:hypothetical protein
MEGYRDLSELVGVEISAVCFVMDYVEGPILRSLSHPTVSVTGRTYRFPETGSRDALCSVTGSTVRELDLQEGRALRLTMDAGYEVTIPLDVMSLRGPEAMHFVPRVSGPIQVW